MNERERKTEEPETEHGAATREGEVGAQPRAEPSKQHGDALIDGSGTRHGVREAGREPDVCP